MTDPNRTRLLAIVVFAVSMAILAVTSGAPVPSAGNSSLSSPSLSIQGPTLTTQLTVDTRVVVGHYGTRFSGVDLAPTQLLGTSLTQLLTATGIHYVRWPSGKLNDEYDIVTNVIHNPNGTTTPGRTDGQAFVSWCKENGCRAILGVPAETNDSSYAAEEVTYVEQTLHFHPAYWEIGNEPGLWTHYGVPWSQWTTSQNSGITPENFARLVQRIAAAIHSVDPAARIIGLPGTGIGAYGENEWIYDTVKLNGPNLSAVAIHIYPAGHLDGATGNLTDFDQSLLAKGAPDERVPLDRAAITSACPTCHIALIATEYNAASVGAIGDSGTYGEFMEGFDEVPYMASEVAQGLSQNMSNLEIYNFESGFPGALVGPTGAVRPVYYLYSQVLPHLDKRAVATNFSGSLGEFFGIVSTNGTSSMTLLLANANPTANVKVDLLNSGLPLTGGGNAWRFTSAMTEPITWSWSGDTTGYWVVPAESVLLIEVR